MASKQELLARAAADPMTSLLPSRVVFLAGQVDDVSADAVISQLLLLDSQDSEKVCCLLCHGGRPTLGCVQRERETGEARGYKTLV